MPLIAPSALDAALAVVAAATHQQICNAEPTNFTEATSTFRLGTNTPSVGSAGNASPDGRKVTVAAVTSGSVTATGTASHHSLTNSTGSVLLAAKSLSATQAVVSSNTYSLTAYDVRIPAAV